MRSGTAVPLITAAVTLPPPAAVILLPNPLATGITPTATIHCRGCQQKGVLVSIQRNSLADDAQAVIDRCGGGEDFEVALRKIAKEI